MTQKTRTDPHRPGAFIPDDYTYCLSYSAPSVSSPIPFGINWQKARDMFEAGNPFRKTLRSCHVCGSAFTHGDIWFHVPSKQLVALGHICADKYGLMCDRSEWSGQKASEIKKRQVSEGKARILDGNSKLQKDLETDHHIVQSIRRRLDNKGYISDAQIDLVHKLARDERERAERKAEREREPKASAPISTEKQVITGTILSAKVSEGYYGPKDVMTVKVTENGAYWLAWGTIPAAVSRQVDRLADLRNRQVSFTATLEPGREPHFAFFKRPSKATLHKPEESVC